MAGYKKNKRGEKPSPEWELCKHTPWAEDMVMKPSGIPAGLPPQLPALHHDHTALGKQTGPFQDPAPPACCPHLLGTSAFCRSRKNL